MDLLGLFPVVLGLTSRLQDAQRLS